MDFGALLFICITLLLIVATLLVLIRTGFARLDGSIGIMSDGISVGKAVPSLSLLDLQGRPQNIPTRDLWQFLIFADYILGAFPLVVSGLFTLSREEDLQVLILSRESRENNAAVARGLNIPVPIVSVEDTVYDQFRVRVMPFACLIDPIGVVHWKGVVNTGEQMTHIWNVAHTLDRETEVVKE